MENNRKYPEDTRLETEGTYPVSIEAVSDKPTKNGKAKLSVKYRVLAGPQKGEVIWGAVFSAAAAGRLFKCAGVDAGYIHKLPSKDDALVLKGNQVTITVGQNGEWLNVTGVDTYDGGDDDETEPMAASTTVADVPF